MEFICKKEQNRDGTYQYIKHGLADPKDKATQLILWLYTIEPPFYAELNRAIVRKDYSKISMFGPFAWALELIFSSAEVSMVNSIKPGCEYHDA